jgi:CDP-glucose 4,6-dehydratase
VKWKALPSTTEHFHESHLLKLNCDKALHFLNWQPVLDFSNTVRFTAQWYEHYYQKTKQESHSTLDLTKKQILDYVDQAKQKGLPWAVQS